MKTCPNGSRLALVLPLAAFGASAQAIHIGPGASGSIWVGLTITGVIREYEDDNGCTVRVVRYRRGDGDMVTRRERHC